MKPIKMFGLAALAALMAMAFVGASSAMAENTGLCSTDAEVCPAITHVHETTLEGAKAKLLGGFITVECDTLFLGDTLEGTSAPLTIHGNFTYTNCGGCTAEETSETSKIEILRESHETAKVTGEGSVFVDCGGSSLECEYDGEGLVGTGKGPLLSSETNGSVVLTNQVVHRVEGSGFLCPKESKLDITTTPLEATYIAAGVHYCVKFEHARGHYLELKEKCKGYDSVPEGNYELIVAPAGYELYQIICVKLLKPIGLYELRNAGKCEMDIPVDDPQIGPYEMATVH